MCTQQNQLGVAKFDRWAKTYDQGRLNSWFKNGQIKVLEALNLEPKENFLDIGCGTGWAVIEGSYEVQTGMACGIDISPEMVECARMSDRGLSNVEFQIADAEAIPYPDQFFDAATCTISFHHYTDSARALSEVHRVLKPGGRFLLLDPNRAGCIWVWLWDRVLRIFEPGHVRYYTEQEIFHLLIDAGFTRPTLIWSEHDHFSHGKLASATCLVSAHKRPSL